MAEDTSGTDPGTSRAAKGAARPRARQSKFVDQLVQDPANVPALGTLVGFVGRGSDDTKTRIYSDAALSSYVEVDADKVRHMEELEDSPLGAMMVWIDAAAEVTPGEPSRSQMDAAKAQADFLSGGIAQGHLRDSVSAKPPGRIPLSWVANTCGNGLCVESFRFCGGFGGIIRSILCSARCPDPVPDFRERFDPRMMQAAQAQAGFGAADFLQGNIMAQHLGNAAAYHPGTFATVCTLYVHCGGVTRGGATLCGGIRTCGGPICATITQGGVTLCGGIRTCGPDFCGPITQGGVTQCGGIRTCGADLCGTITQGGVTLCGGIRGCTISQVAQTCGGGLCQAGTVGAECHFDVTTPQWRIDPEIQGQFGAAAFLGGPIAQAHMQGAAAAHPMAGQAPSWTCGAQAYYPTIRSLAICPSKGLPCWPPRTLPPACPWTLSPYHCGPGPVSIRVDCPTARCPGPYGDDWGTMGPQNPTAATHCFICPPMTHAC